MTTSYTNVKQRYIEGNDYNIITRESDSDISIIAPHGGFIEHGTDQIALYIASDDFSFYCFNGLCDPSHHLHISSTLFDEPKLNNLLAQTATVITIHGCKGAEPYVYFGGRHQSLIEILIDELIKAGYPATMDPNPQRKGLHENNICNRGLSQQGVQIELTQGFRKQLFAGSESWEQLWQPKAELEQFTQLIRQTLLNYTLE